jgi:hypothetical protein
MGRYAVHHPPLDPLSEIPILQTIVSQGRLYSTNYV